MTQLSNGEGDDDEFLDDIQGAVSPCDSVVVHAVTRYGFVPGIVNRGALEHGHQDEGYGAADAKGQGDASCQFETLGRE